MSPLHRRLRPREEEVTSKVIDGEAIIINLANGMYYSMDKVGGMIWEMVQGSHTLDEIVATIVARYDVLRGEAQADVERLTAELLQENLVAVSDHDLPLRENHELLQERKLPYEVPKLNRYSDLGDLLALDPPTPGLQEIVWKEPDDESPRPNERV